MSTKGTGRMARLMASELIHTMTAASILVCEQMTTKRGGEWSIGPMGANMKGNIKLGINTGKGSSHGRMGLCITELFIITT